MKIYCIKCSKFKKRKKYKVSNNCHKTFFLFTFCKKSGNNNGKILREEEPIKI